MHGKFNAYLHVVRAPTMINLASWGKGGVLAFFAFARRLNFNCFKWHLLSIEKGVEKLHSNGNHQSEDSSRHRVEIEIGSKGKRRRKEKHENGKRREAEGRGKRRKKRAVKWIL